MPLDVSLNPSLLPAWRRVIHTYGPQISPPWNNKCCVWGVCSLHLQLDPKMYDKNVRKASQLVRWGYNELRKAAVKCGEEVRMFITTVCREKAWTGSHTLQCHVTGSGTGTKVLTASDCKENTVRAELVYRTSRWSNWSYSGRWERNKCIQWLPSSSFVS